MPPRPMSQLRRFRPAAPVRAESAEIFGPGAGRLSVVHGSAAVSSSRSERQEGLGARAQASRSVPPLNARRALMAE
jgi:hypothetical protein